MLTRKRYLILGIPLATFLIGVTLIVAGFLYGVFTVGVPTQDATPEIAAREKHNVNIGQGLFIFGVCIATPGLVFSLVGGGLLAMWRFADRRVPDRTASSSHDPKNTG